MTDILTRIDDVIADYEASRADKRIWLSETTWAQNSTSGTATRVASGSWLALKIDPQPPEPAPPVAPVRSRWTRLASILRRKK